MLRSSADPYPTLSFALVGLTIRTCSVVASAFRLLGRWEPENATEEGFEGGCACGYDASVDLEKTPELDIVRTAHVLVDSFWWMCMIRDVQ